MSFTPRHTALQAVVPVCAVLILATALSACGRPETSESLYRSSEIGVAKQVRRCRILEVREVVIRGDNQGEGAIAGAIAGGILAGTAASTIGSGTGSRLATQVGALAGAGAGAAIGEAIQENLSERKGLEYGVIFEDGDEITIAQEFLETDRVLQPGDTCRFQQQAGGVGGRILPAEHLVDEIQAPKETIITY